MGINDDNFISPRSHNFIELDMSMFSSQSCASSSIITIVRTPENTREFCAIMHLFEEKKNLRRQSEILVQLANTENVFMQKSLEKHEKRLTRLNEEIAFSQQTLVENMEDIDYLKHTIEDLKEKLIRFGEEEAVREIMEEESDEERVPNEE